MANFINTVLNMVGSGAIEARELESSCLLDLQKILEDEKESIVSFKKIDGVYELTYQERLATGKTFEHYLYAEKHEDIWKVSNCCLSRCDDHLAKATNLFLAIKKYIATEQAMHKHNIRLMSHNTVYITSITANNVPWHKDGESTGLFSFYYEGQYSLCGFRRRSGKTEVDKLGKSSYPEYKTVPGIGPFLKCIFGNNAQIKVICEIPKQAWMFQEDFLFPKCLELNFDRMPDDSIHLLAVRKDVPFSSPKKSNNVNILQEIDQCVSCISKHDNGQGFILSIKVNDPYFTVNKAAIITRIKNTGCKATIVIK